LGVEIEHVQILGVCDNFLTNFDWTLQGEAVDTMSPNVEFAKRSNPSILGAAFMGH